jgi:hypothetical protein
MITYFVVQTFEVTKAGRIVARTAVQSADRVASSPNGRNQARRPGVAIAFSRTGDMSSGDFDDAVVLGQFGSVPEEIPV